jgi:uncharacterized membrane protein
MDRFMKAFTLFLTGGILYFYMEIIYRGYSHYSMILCGGMCFYLVGGLNQWSRRELPFLIQMLLGAIIITGLEFLTGVLVNLWLGLSVWDYSYMPFNLLGQICLPYSILWLLLSAVIILLDDFLRYRLFDEEKQQYRLFL